MEIERRYLPIKQGGVEIRSAEENGAQIVEGRAIVYEKETVLYSSSDYEIREIIARGAAKEAVEKKTAMLLWQHDWAMPMARHQNNTLEAVEDSDGVVIRADVSKTSWGREGFEAIRNGVVDSMSFGFRAARDGEEWRRYVDASGKTVEVRTIKKIAELWDYSPVTFPAYEETSIQSRSKDLAFAHRPKDLGALPGDEQRAREAHELELSLESERLEIIEKEMSV